MPQAGAVWYAMRSALKARQKSAKDSLLQQLPTIGQRDRRKPSVDMTQINPAWMHHHHKHSGSGLGGHSRQNSGVDLGLGGGPGAGSSGSSALPVSTNPQLR